MPYQLNAAALEGSRALILHDMPMHVGYEISREMVEDPRAVIFEQAENRMHGEKALILGLLGLI
jgi:ornithine carbamoyltransferase